MRPLDASLQVLRKVFKRKKVVDLEALMACVQSRSRMTVFRRLKQLNYLSSFTHAGRFYTLPEIPTFDEHGVWRHHDIGFSRAGTLKNTLLHLAETAQAGLTFSELEQLLRVGVQNALLDLVRCGHLKRQSFEKIYLYLSADPQRAPVQMAARKKLQESVKSSPSLLPTSLVIEVLAEAIQTAKVIPSAFLVAKRLNARGQSVSLSQVEQIFRRYELDPQKKSKA